MPINMIAGTSPSACTPACSDRPTCGNCTGGLCMWCKNLNMCIDRNAYLASFPYGQCMDWTTKADECPLAPSKNDSKVKECATDNPLPYYSLGRQVVKKLL